MKNLCILCDDANVIEARERCLSTLPVVNPERLERILSFKRAKNPDIEFGHLKIPVSATGEYPATHWFCFITVNEETHQKMLDNQKHTIIEEGVPSEFLAKHGLSKIKTY
jgi:hypothetical protein